MTTPSIKTVLVLGATGNTAPTIIHALATHPSQFIVHATTRDKSNVSLLPGAENVTIHETDYSPASLSSIFTGVDAIVSPLPATLASRQREFIDLAIAAGVSRFFPSEFGVDSAHPNIKNVLPIVSKKTQIVDYLKKNEDKITWSAIIVGSYFDWTFSHPGWMGWDVPNGKAVIFDGGETEFEATNVVQIGRAIAASLTPRNIDKTKNQYVYINSFTLTQKKVLGALERVTGQKFEISTSTVKELYIENSKKVAKDPTAGMMLVQAALYGYGGVSNFSRYEGGKGLWNERLGLPEEDLEETLREIIGRF
ncbi:hypothetical protein BGZ60DRAFT_401355 [Tricladium varicosporioides]|nr:hypothetical protein BGZ60DRAFT_401355 [Hymenoscyphus varicosporioides]